MNLEDLTTSTSGEADELDRSIESLAVIRPREPITKIENPLRRNPCLSPEAEAIDLFLVSDVLGEASYVVSGAGSQIQLLVPLKDQLIVAKVSPEADLPEVADKLLNQLAE